MNARPWGSFGHVAALGLALFAMFALPANAARCLGYEPNVVNLTGTISMGHGFGPPGFGEDPEHDMKLSYPLLTVDRPICVDKTLATTDSDAVKEAGVKALEMVHSDEHPFKREWLKQHVVVTGTLYHSYNGYHQTSVLISVSKTKILPRKRTRRWRCKLC